LVFLSFKFYENLYKALAQAFYLKYFRLFFHHSMLLLPNKLHERPLCKSKFLKHVSSKNLSQHLSISYSISSQSPTLISSLWNSSLPVSTQNIWSFSNESWRFGKNFLFMKLCWQYFARNTSKLWWFETCFLAPLKLNHGLINS